MWVSVINFAISLLSRVTHSPHFHIQLDKISSKLAIYGDDLAEK